MGESERKCALGRRGLDVGIPGRRRAEKPEPGRQSPRPGSCQGRGRRLRPFPGSQGRWNGLGPGMEQRSTAGGRDGRRPCPAGQGPGDRQRCGRDRRTSIFRRPAKRRHGLGVGIERPPTARNGKRAVLLDPLANASRGHPSHRRPGRRVLSYHRPGQRGWAVGMGPQLAPAKKNKDG